MPKVSVIIAIYNAERYLEKCLDSICSQTLREIEIICVNDGSTDNSSEILKAYVEKDNRIKVLSQKNQYAGVARNNGMKCATGKYLSFLDADDYFEPNMLEKMYQRAEEKKADIVICQSSQYDERTGNITVFDSTFINSFFGNKEEFSGWSLKYAGIFQITNGWAWDKLFRANFVYDCGYEFSDFRSSEDGFFVYMLTARANKISYIDDILVIHRINGINSLSNTREANWMNGFKMLYLIKNELIKQSIYNVYEQSFLNRVLSFLVWYLGTINSFEAFKKCYLYIQTDMEPLIGILKHEKGYYFGDEYYHWYQKITTLSLDEYLYLEKEKHLRTIRIQSETIRKQQKALAEKKWVFPYRLMEKGKIVILYGAGKLGQAYHSQLSDSGFCSELIWVDKQYDKYRDVGVTVQSPEVIFQKKFDYIVIAVKNKEVYEEIKKWLLEQGVEEKKIKWIQ